MTFYMIKQNHFQKDCTIVLVLVSAKWVCQLELSNLLIALSSQITHKNTRNFSYCYNIAKRCHVKLGEPNYYLYGLG